MRTLLISNVKNAASEDLSSMADSVKKTSKKSGGNGKHIPKLLKMRDELCSALSYRFKVAAEKFDLDALRNELHVKPDTKKGFAVVNTRDVATEDYHAHFEWRVRPNDEITIEVKYVASPVKSKPGEQEPFSDNLMRWVGQFFKHRDANARIHSDFEFEAKKTTLSWFPLPLQTKISNLGGKEAILDGIAVALPSEPDSVSRFFLSKIQDTVYVGIESERRIKFDEFSLDSDIQIERSFADKLIEVKL